MKPDVTNGISSARYGLSLPRQVCKNTVIIGVMSQELLGLGAPENTHPVRAFASRTGKLLRGAEFEAGVLIPDKAKDSKKHIFIAATGSGCYDKTGGDRVAIFARS